MNQTTSVSEDPRYPIGRFQTPAHITPEQRAEWIEIIRAFPAAMRSAVEGLNDAQLDTPYREGGWTVRQLVHHVADSHINAYTRFRLALTEDNPTICPYLEELWAELPDANSLPIHYSLELLVPLHHRWVVLMNALTEEQWKRTYYHPQNNSTSALDIILALYAWHCSHHCAHATSLHQRMGW